jgi:GT2 family glycosyltransferase
MIKDFVNILVVTYNRLEYLKVFIEMLYLSTSYPFRLIVIDNGSHDGSREFILEMEKKKLVNKHVFNQENLPLAKALTEGFKCVESELFITVADDMMAPIFKNPDWLEIFIAQMKQDEQIGCINFKASRQSFRSFNIKRRPLIYDKIKREGGEMLEKFNMLQKMIYDR